MRLLMNFASSLVGLYSLLIVIRILLTWFESTRYSRPAQILSRITDPYLDWWRRTMKFRLGILDFSPIVAIIALSIVQTILATIALHGRISLGIVLAVCLSALWSAVSFVLAFCCIVLVLRMIAYLGNRDMYGLFWQTVDTISRPILYRINRIIFGRRIMGYMTSIIVSLVALGALWVAGRIAVRLLVKLLGSLPV